MRKLIIILIVFTQVPSFAGVLEDFPSLRKYTFHEDESAINLGFGISPLGVMGNRIEFSADVFQIDWMNARWDIQLLDASFGYVTSQNSLATSYDVSLRFSPKYRVNSFLSIGPMVGWEFISFPNATARIYNNGFATPWEPFSSNGLVYGGVLSELFTWGSDHFIRLTEMVYRQTYSTTQTSDGWTYVFQNNSLQADHTPIEPSTVFMVEISFLY